MLDSMTSREYEEWKIFYSKEPFGEVRQDIRFANLMAMQANINRDSKRHPDQYFAKDFMLDFSEHEEKPVDLESILPNW